VLGVIFFGCAKPEIPPASERGPGEACDTSSQCQSGLQCLQDVCAVGACRVASDCQGIPSASCAVWACVASRCLAGCFDAGVENDAGIGLTDSGAHPDAAQTLPDAGLVCGDVKTATSGDLLLNEFLADPPAGIDGDANLDGVFSTSEDEFVEIGNISGNKLQLAGVTISDARSVRHVFSEYELDCGQVVVVFADGITAQWPANWLVSSSGGLSFNNGGDTIEIRSSTTATGVIDSYMYGAEGGRDQSLTRSPDLLKDARFVRHSDLPPNRLFSPGTRANGNPF
jgi:hypothetical protein